MINALFDLLRYNPEVQSLIKIATITLLSILVTKLNRIKLQADKDYQSNLALAQSTKRVALRSEYLQIVNSNKFTNRQKYSMTRYLMEEYEKLNGNHYLHEVDETLRLAMEERPDDVD